MRFRSHNPRIEALLLVAAAMLGEMACRQAVAQDLVPPNAESYATAVAPILATRCFGCHGAEQQEGNLRLDTLEGLNRGGRSGPAIIPGSSDESLLVAAIRRTDEALRMPPDEPLPNEEVELLVRWITAGALHPDGQIVAPPIVPPFHVEDARKFWAFQAVSSLPPSASNQVAAAQIDVLVEKLLAERGLAMNPRADKRTLLRRATQTLTGLPPSSSELAAFLADETDNAIENVIERLLASPAYGERWGRHWLDVVRYADSNGLDENIAHGNAWRYRNYVIDSFNADKPWDQFVTEQLAGDLLNDSDTPEALRNERLTATGFLLLGPKVLAEGDETKMQMDIIDEQLDTIGRSMLGLTIGCARCHNHKFDPISQADYYSLAGIFQSTQSMESFKRIAKWNENSIATTADHAAVDLHQQLVTTKKAEIDTTVTSAMDSIRNRSDGDNRQPADVTAVSEEQFSEDVRQRLATLREELKSLESATPELPTAMGVRDGQITDARILPRGSHLTPGRTVARGVPVVLMPSQGFQIAESTSGRREVAHWIASDSNPLTARVIVNRVWRWHFGRGLVVSMDNFGLQGERPANQALLDFLASDFVQGGWSLKSLHRRILLSRAWQQSSADQREASVADPDNAMLWRWTMRRLDAEALRDSLLAVSGQLDRAQGQSLLHVKNREFLFDHTSKDGTTYASTKRSVYLPVIRNNLYDAMSLFDCTDGTVPNGDRSTSTVASQALFLMNSDLAIEASQRIAGELLLIAESDEARTDRLFQQVLLRQPSESERSQMLAAATHLADQLTATDGNTLDRNTAVWTALCQSLLMSNEFLYID